MPDHICFEPEMVLVPAGSFSMGTGPEHIGRLAARLTGAAHWRDAGYFAREQPAHALHLPTKAEWEKAARGTANRPFRWGDESDPACTDTREGGQHIVDVDAYSPACGSPYGCAGMGGNVSQWTSSRYQAYPYQASDGREDPASDAPRVIRGGSFLKDALRSRTAARGMNDPWFHDDDVGFRCAASL
jgi:formylglycine-generating enzyme required for sulfatase activity